MNSVLAALFFLAHAHGLCSRLQAERQYNAVSNQQLLASVALVKALGGGWEARAAETKSMHSASK